MNTCLYSGLESGQHVDILPMFSIALDPRVVNMFRVVEYVLLYWDLGVASMLRCN